MHMHVTRKACSCSLAWNANCSRPHCDGGSPRFNCSLDSILLAMRDLRGFCATVSLEALFDSEESARDSGDRRFRWKHIGGRKFPRETNRLAKASILITTIPGPEGSLNSEKYRSRSQPPVCFRGTRGRHENDREFADC
jgi:hypothetical protein